MDLPVASPLERSRENALVVLSRVLLWGIAPVALIGVSTRVIDGMHRGETVRSAMMLPPLMLLVAVALFIGARHRYSRTARGWGALLGMSTVIGWGFLFNGPRVPNAVGAVVVVSLAILLLEDRREFVLLIGSLLALLALGVILRYLGIIEPAIDPMNYPFIFMFVSTTMMIACLGFGGYLLRTTLQSYQAAQRELAERAQELLVAQQRMQELQQRETFAKLATGMASELAEVVAVLGAASDEFRSHLADERGHQLLQDVQSVGTRVSQVLRLLASLDPAVPMQPLAVSEMMQRLREQLPVMLPSNVTLEILDLVAGARTVRCDRVEQVMWYLVLQARDAMPDGGTLTIRAYEGLGDMARTGEHRNWVIIDVADMGAPDARRGLPQRLIAEPHTASASATKGFGLAVVDQVITGCGGRLDMERAPGQPVHFVLQLPAATA